MGAASQGSSPVSCCLRAFRHLLLGVFNHQSYRIALGGDVSIERQSPEAELFREALHRHRPETLGIGDRYRFPGDLVQYQTGLWAPLRSFTISPQPFDSSLSSF